MYLEIDKSIWIVISYLGGHLEQRGRSERRADGEQTHRRLHVRVVGATHVLAVQQLDPAADVQSLRSRR